jgi:UDP-N-acetylglucosamine 2-epimerase (non-hydrolysing)
MIMDMIAGARPNFVKIAALYGAARTFPAFKLRFIHTGQHYDYQMSEVFLHQLGLPEPDSYLGVGSASHAVQTAEIMKGYEAWCLSNQPDLCMVVGDVNSAVATALVAVKLGIPVAHVESGLRSFDRSMPEEINRILTDSISTLHFVSEPSGIVNLANEGHTPDSIHFVGQVMVDSLLRMLDLVTVSREYETFGVSSGEYAYVTLHRPANVDYRSRLASLCHELVWLADQMPIVFPVHPRTKRKLEEFSLLQTIQHHERICLSEPVDYITSLSLLKNAAVAITDSGGLQEEATVLGIPCLTLRENTERPITVYAGTNTLIGTDFSLFRTCVEQVIDGKYKKSMSPIPYWDGKAADRIFSILNTVYCS